ncbi:glycosyl hydrolase family 18 protein [Rhodocytophaga aerolata]|uniref:chitinase n=1 Tax=Rhodocytophaga aerolata TaxID=455078 RepID=A0ABT8RA21_9BACT|nr:glycosyl hydrolase family 18 protein [Rhodocytophaga aerolata]MDO1448949.1 glycosyl hydrolase family 18 protein [Rhodocytophaga aerolata]
MKKTNNYQSSVSGFWFLVGLLLLVFMSLSDRTSAQTKTKSAKDRFKIVGYYPLKAALTADLTKVPFDKLTHINLWFVNPDSLGNFTQEFTGLRSFIDAAHAREVKVLFSIGGGSKQAQYHQLLQPEKRSSFIQSLVSLANREGVDGVDVDLEGSDIDENYEPFVVELAAALRTTNKLITAAIAVYYKDQLSDKALATYDFVNVMSYDRTGPWRPDKPGPHATYEHALEDLTYFGKERQLSKQKMTLGVPFYGYGYDLSGKAAAISMNFKEITQTYPGSHLADELKMPDGKMLYYNGLETIKKKVQLAKKQASGIMIWQLMGDAEGEYSLLNYINKVAAENK